MSCPDLMKEISASGSRLSATASEHLATCPDCSRWASEVAHFDQLWALSRPTEPDPAQFTQLWNQVSQVAQVTAATPVLFSASTSQPVVLEFQEDAGKSSSPWSQKVKLGLVISALAAAAVLMMAGLPPMLGSRAGNLINQPGTGETPIVVENFESEPGQTLFIQISGPNVIAENRPTTDISETITVAAELDILNFMESQSQGAL